MLFYRFLITLVAPVFFGMFLVRVLKGQETKADLRERLGFWVPTHKGATFWFHGASNGELTAARHIVEAALNRRKDVQMLITCNSTSAKAMVRAWGLERVDVRLAPLDISWVQRRLINALKLEKFVLFEGDFWPNRIFEAKQSGAQLALIGGRISEKSARIWRYFPRLARRMFQAFDLICPQDSRSAAHIKALKGAGDAFGPNVNLKSLYCATLDIAPHDRRKDFWLAASTHVGEDEILLKAQKLAMDRAPQLRMILAPRHPKRARQIVELAEKLGLHVTQRSQGDLLSEQSDVYLADTLGELELWYQAAATCFVAGSLVPKGGHTPFEPAFHDCALLHGPHLSNFSDAYGALQKEGGAIECIDAPQIADALVKLRDKEPALALRENAKRALVQTDVLAEILDALVPPAKT